MDVRERILAAMMGEEPDRIPLTIYEALCRRSYQERLLREAGLGLICRLPAHREQARNVEVSARVYRQAGQAMTRRTIHTPVGEVWQTTTPDISDYGSSEWTLEHYIKGPDDYRVMEFVVRDPAYVDNYDAIRQNTRRIGGDGLVLVRLAKAPLQEMIYCMMGIERFSIDFHERRDLVDSLHAVMKERYRELYELAAGAPVDIIQLADNTTSDVIGRERFRQYLMPVYEELSDCLAGTGKKLAVHMDGRIASLADEVAEARFDIVEALTPAPMGDLSVAEARQCWPDKALWINYTSSMHVAGESEIEAHTRELVEQAGTRRGFAIGVTEDAPAEPLERSLRVIAGVLAEQ